MRDSRDNEFEAYVQARSSVLLRTAYLIVGNQSDAEDLLQTALAKASESVRNIHWFEVVETRGHVEDGKVAHWQVTIKAGFTLED